MSKAVVTAALMLFVHAASADWAAEPAWESPAELKNPESVVYDAKRKQLIVSNVNGGPTDKDGNGFLSLLDLDGRIKTLQWVTELNAPKGMAIAKDKLYVADIDTLITVDLQSGRIADRHPVANAQFLNDVAADSSGNVYVSDMARNIIYRQTCCAFETWLESPKLENPNGLTVNNNHLYVGAWGVMDATMATKVPGHVKIIALKDKSIASMGSDKPVGNMDGIERLPDGQILATDWVAGTLMTVSPKGQVSRLQTLAPGAADLTYIKAQSLAIVPMMKDNKLRAFRLQKH